MRAHRAFLAYRHRSRWHRSRWHRSRWHCGMAWRRARVGPGTGDPDHDRRPDGAVDDQRRRDRPGRQPCRLYRLHSVSGEQHPRDRAVRAAGGRWNADAARRRGARVRAGAAGAAASMVTGRNSISFLAIAGGRPQVFAVSASGGAASALTDAAEGVSGYEWSPDGKQLAFLTRDQHRHRRSPIAPARCRRLRACGSSPSRTRNPLAR